LTIKPDGALYVIRCLAKVILVRPLFYISRVFPQVFEQNIALPAQIFAKVVPSFGASNIPALGMPYPQLALLRFHIFYISILNFYRVIYLNSLYRPYHPDFDGLSILWSLSGLHYQAGLLAAQ
jgi:hypothetical protein